ncbi:hypothetical protein JL720_4681 [Aureococcus anophagefferens]|nr:hypothetical protein JL720_4681 [Aureococcus anophagefferens]
MARERNEARLMEALMSKQPDPFAAILAWEDDRPFPRDFRLAAECSKRAGVLAMMADMRCDEAMRTQAFAALLRAMVLSDSRVGAMGHTLQALRLPEAFFHVTEDFAFTGEMCLCRLDPAVFIARVAASTSATTTTAPCASGRRVCHELLAHLDAGSVDLSALDAAAAADGGSVNRRLYRSPEGDRGGAPGARAPTTAELLDAVEALARRQVDFDGDDARGHWNLGWVAQERVQSGRADGHAEAADHFLAALVRADARGNDIVSATSRIEHAGCLISAPGYVDLLRMRRLKAEARAYVQALKPISMDPCVYGESSYKNVLDGFLDHHAALRKQVRRDAGPDREVDKLMVPTVGEEGMAIRRAGERDMGAYGPRGQAAALAWPGHKKACKAAAKEAASR